MVEPGPKLVSVDGESVKGPPGAAAPAPRAPRAKRGFWLIAALLVVAVAALAVQTRRVTALSGQVENLTAELAAARAALAAYEGHLERVRASVSDLQARFADLDALVRRDPLSPPSSPQD